MQQLSKRLTAVAAMVSSGSRLADIGTDHAYVPIRLVQEGRIPGALAMDVFEDETEIYHHRRINDIIANRSMAYLRQFPNVILTQHMAFYTDVNTRSMVECGLKGIVELAAGRSQGL